MTSYKQYKANFALKWIKSDSGKTYLCPVGAPLSENPSEEELKRHCINESHNPQND